MKKKMLTLLLALVMMVSVIPGASAAGTQPQDDSSTIFRSPNRYYYVTEYTDYFKTTTITITEQYAATNQHLQNAISAAMGVFASGANPITGVAVNFAMNELISFACNGNPTARVGDYIVKTRYKIKYKVDSLDPSNKVATDTWVQFLFDYLGDSEEPYLTSYRLK